MTRRHIVAPGFAAVARLASRTAPMSGALTHTAGRVWHSSAKFKAGAIIMAIFVIAAIAGPLIFPHPLQTGPALLQPPSGRYPLGTTQTGQDVLAQVVAGARPGLLVAFLAGLVATVVGIGVGIPAGFFTGIAEDALTGLSNVVLVLPALPLVIVIAAYLRSSNPYLIALIIGLTIWPSNARMLHAQTLSLRRRDYVEAAQTAGEGAFRVMFCEILPNEVGVIASAFLFSSLFGLLTAAGLDFLGVGSLSVASWGDMLFYAQNGQALSTGAWWWFVPPGLCIGLFGTALALLNFGIDEMANPRLRTGESGHWRRARRRRRPRAVARFTRIRAALRNGAADVDGRAARGLGTGGPGPGANGACRPGQALVARGVTVEYAHAGQRDVAVNGVDLELGSGEILGVVGESGCGKSTLAYALARLLKPPAFMRAGATITYCLDSAGPGGPGAGPVDILALSGEELRRFRWVQLAVVFQSAQNALNPVSRIGTQLADVIRAHESRTSRHDRTRRVCEMLESVSIPADRRNSFPHELSGGMRQRVCIAMALALRPAVLIMDEPTTALDVVVQRDILSRTLSARDRFRSAIVFITHDMSLLLEISDRIAVMYAGRIVELAAAADILERPKHPYTVGLLNSFPPLRGEKVRLQGIGGTPPSLGDPPEGCAFAPRCKSAFAPCRERVPALRDVAGDGRRQAVACFLHDPDITAMPDAVNQSAAGGAGDR